MTRLGGALSVVIVLVPFSALGDTYHVSATGDDGWPGTVAEPWRTLQFAADAAGAGDTVLVEEGNYPENVVFGRSGSQQDGYIVFQSYEDDVVTLDPGSFSARDESYIKVIGFHVRNPNGERPGIEFSGDGGYVEVRENEITGCSNDDAAALRIGGHMHHFIVDRNHIHHNDTGSQEALRVHEHTSDFEITNNEVNHNSNIGIDVVGWAQYGKPVRGLIRGNISHENSQVSDWSAGVYLDCPSDITVEYNISWGNVRGLEIGCEPPGDTSSGNVIRYNIAYGNSGSGIQIGGYQGGIVRDSEVSNNVLFENGGLEIGFDSTPGTDNRIINNILYDPGTTLVGAGGSNLIDFNCYHGGTGPGASSVEADPLFVNAAAFDFRLREGSLCIDAGDPATPAGIDFDGAPTPVDGDGDGSAVVDMGAFEFGGQVTPPECGDGIDNDGDGEADYPDDSGCDSSDDSDESNCGDSVCEGGETQASCSDDCTSHPCIDRDQDGYGDPASGECEHGELDCNDDDDHISPVATEVCDDGVDNDCDGQTDLDDDTDCGASGSEGGGSGGCGCATGSGVSTVWWLLLLGLVARFSRANRLRCDVKGEETHTRKTIGPLATALMTMGLCACAGEAPDQVDMDGAAVADGNPGADATTGSDGPASTDAAGPGPDSGSPLGEAECDNWQTAHPDWLWCDDFEDGGQLSDRYPDTGSTGMSVGQESPSLPNPVLIQHYDPGQIDAGWVSFFYGDTLGNDYGPIQDDVHMRWYHKFEEGFQGLPPKMARVTSIGPGWDKRFGVHFWISGGEIVADVKAPYSSQANDAGWLAVVRSGFSFTDPANLGRWICLEMRVKANTPGLTDGAYEFWADGQKIVDEQGVDLVGSTGYHFNHAMLDCYWNGGSPADQARYYDNFVVSTERIGCD